MINGNRQAIENMYKQIETDLDSQEQDAKSLIDTQSNTAIHNIENDTSYYGMQSDFNIWSNFSNSINITIAECNGNLFDIALSKDTVCPVTGIQYLLN